MDFYCKLPKLRTWVRFPSPAPKIRKIPVDSAALTHLASLDLRPKGGVLRPFCAQISRMMFGAMCLMKLKREQSQKLLRERGIWVTGACDKWGQLLDSVRWTRKGERGEWCSAACRDGIKITAPAPISKTCRECGASLDGKRADSQFCSHTHQMRFSRKSRTSEKHENSRDAPIGNQGLTDARNDRSTNTLTRPSQVLE